MRQVRTNLTPRKSSTRHQGARVRRQMGKLFWLSEWDKAYFTYIRWCPGDKSRSAKIVGGEWGRPFAAKSLYTIVFWCILISMLSRLAAAICEVCFKHAGDLKQSDWEQSDLWKHLQSELDQAPGWSSTGLSIRHAVPGGPKMVWSRSQVVLQKSEVFCRIRAEKTWKILYGVA